MDLFRYFVCYVRLPESNYDFWFYILFFLQDAIILLYHSLLISKKLTTLKKLVVSKFHMQIFMNLFAFSLNLNITVNYYNKTKK